MVDGGVAVLESRAMPRTTMLLAPALALSVLVAACGGSKPPPADAPAPADSSATAAVDSAAPAGSDAPAAAPATTGIPTACANTSSSVCTLPSDFVERLCAKPHQDIALALFGKTPFSRLYLKGKMDELAFQEEVLALRFHGQPKGGMQVGSGNGTYDVLRWDGSCSMAVDADILSTSSPGGRPRSARVLWLRVGDKTQTALIAGSDAVKKAHAKRGKECQGAMSGDVSAACQKADTALVDAVVDYVRAGGTLPTPDAP
jgi:hypothetical protein